MSKAQTPDGQDVGVVVGLRDSGDSVLVQFSVPVTWVVMDFQAAASLSRALAQIVHIAEGPKEGDSIQ